MGFSTKEAPEEINIMAQRLTVFCLSWLSYGRSILTNWLTMLIIQSVLRLILLWLAAGQDWSDFRQYSGCTKDPL